MNLRPFLSSRKTLLGAVVTLLGATAAIVQHLLMVADGAPLSLEVVFAALAAAGSAITGFFAKDADSTGVTK